MRKPTACGHPAPHAAHPIPAPGDPFVEYVMCAGAPRQQEPEPTDRTELERMLSYRRGLCTRAEALESLRKLDPVLRAYRAAGDWLD